MTPTSRHATSPSRRRVVHAGLLAVAMLAAVLAAAAPSTAAPEPSASRLVRVDPQRVLDTRTGVGVPAGIVAAGGSVELDADAAAPAGVGTVTAVVLNVTVTEATGPGFVQVYPTGSGLQGASSNLNVELAGQTIANLVVAPVGTDGKVTLFSQGGAHLIADVSGYFVRSATATDGRYMPLTPSRLLDTRSQAPGRLPAGGSVAVAVRGQAGVPASGAAAVVVNATVVDATAAGFVQVIPTGGTTAIGGSSNLNVDRAGQTIPNLVIVPIGADGTITVHAQSGAHLLLDVVGYFTDGTVASGADGLFVPVAPARMLDTRSGAKPAPGSRTRVTPLGRGGVPGSAVTAVFANVTATDAAPGWVQALPATAAAAEVGRYSTVNVDHLGQTIPNAAVANLGGNGAVDLFASSAVHLLVDVAGYFTSAPIVPTTTTPPAPSIAIASPAAGTVSGNLTVTAATTGTGLLGVQFFVDGSPLGPEDITAPYSTTWVTADAPNGDYTLTAELRLASGTLTSAARTVHVSNAILTLTFDDGWTSQLPAAQALHDAGLPASFYPMSEFLSAPYMTVEQLAQIKAMGHEIGSHTKTHPNLTTLTTEAALAELTDSQTTLNALGLGPIVNFVSPYGASNPAVRAQIAGLYNSHRSIDHGINYPADRRNFSITDPGYTGYSNNYLRGVVPFDRYDLTVRNILGSYNPAQWHEPTTPAIMQGWLDELRAAQLEAHGAEYRANAWMIFVFHEVAENPSAGLPTDPPEVRNEYNVQPAVFAEFIEQIKASGVRVLTMQQALVETTVIAG